MCVWGRSNKLIFYFKKFRVNRSFGDGDGDGIQPSVVMGVVPERSGTSPDETKPDKSPT